MDLTRSGIMTMVYRGSTLVMALMIIALDMSSALAQERVGITEVKPQVLVFSTTKGNVVASVGQDGVLLVGTPSASSTPRINSFLKNRTASAFRYVVIGPQDAALSDGDAGWGKLGAFVAMQENALQRIGGNKMGAPSPLSSRFMKLGVNRPRIAFSEVLAFDLNGEAIHIVRQTPGYSNSDAITHFHVANLVYLGEVFPGDGYPRIDPAQGGKLDGLVKTLEAWTDARTLVVPAHGKVTNGASVKDFRDMIMTVRDRIQAMIKDGKTETQVVAKHPASDFDGRWGHGRVSSDTFVHELYAELTTP